MIEVKFVTSAIPPGSMVTGIITFAMLSLETDTHTHVDLPPGLDSHHHPLLEWTRSLAAANIPR